MAVAVTRMHPTCIVDDVPLFTEADDCFDAFK
jgi:hypothetical protein